MPKPRRTDPYRAIGKSRCALPFTLGCRSDNNINVSTEERQTIHQLMLGETTELPAQHLRELGLRNRFRVAARSLRGGFSVYSAPFRKTN